MGRYTRMLHRVKVLLVGLLAVGLLTPPAYAAKRGHMRQERAGIPNAVDPRHSPARFSATGQIAEMVEIGAKYWAARGFTHCPGFQFELADDFPEGAYGQAPVGECHGWLDRATFSYPTRSWYTLKMRCTIVVHEMGHGNGLEHVEDGGLMDPFYAEPPHACRAWAKANASSR